MLEKVIRLDEVRMNPAKSINTEIIGSKKKGRYLPGLGVNDDYAHLISGEVTQRGILGKIIFLVKFKRGYSNEGVFLVKLFNETSMSLVGEEPLSKLYELDVSDYSDVIEVKLNEKIELEGSFEFFIFMKRAIPNKQFIYE